MTNKQAYAGLLERLEEEALSKAGSSIDRGCVDCGLSATLCNEAAEAISSLLKALEEAALGFDKHARLWRASAERTDLIEDRLRAENAEALAERMRAALNSDAPLSIGEGL